MNRYALAAATLLFSAVCSAQTLQQQPSRTVEQASPGAFQPADGVPTQAAGASRLSPGAQPGPVLSIGKEYKVGPNDLLEVEVLNLEKQRESGKRTVRVNAAGYITLPLVGAVSVAGLTQQQAEAHIATLYGEKYLQDPQVSVFIKEFTTERITVDGAVTKPGIYPLVGQMTLLRALALAGGFGQIANSSEVMLFRQGENGERQVARYNVDKIRSGREPDPQIRGDDLIVVQRDSTRALLKDSVLRDVIDSINPFAVFR